MTEERLHQSQQPTQDVLDPRTTYNLDVIARKHYWANRSLSRLYARIAHSFVSLPSTALTYSLARSFSY